MKGRRDPLAPSKANLPRRDDLPAIKASKFRAAKIITPDTRHFSIELAGGSFAVDVAHTKLMHGGGWSFWICPSCQRLAQTLRLLGTRLVCRSCDGLLARCQMRDKGPRMARLAAKLEGKVKKRRRLEASLRRALIVERRERLNGWPPK
jgi:hypothetical protein